VRRAFDLIPEDLEYLQACQLQWEAIREGKAHWVVVHDLPIPSGYDRSHASVA